jgi:putative endonuclease
MVAVLLCARFIFFMKDDLLNRISEEISRLNAQDADGHLWWNKFKGVVEEVAITSEPKEKVPFHYENNCEWVPEINGFIAYVLYCKGGRTYTGYSGSFRQRMLAHFNGFGCQTTKSWKPEYIMHYEVFESKSAAISREKYFKSYHGKNWLKSKPSNLTSIKPNGNA